MWLYAGFFDPFIYENTGDLKLAREPVYFAMKQLLDVAIGAGKTVERLDLGDWVYAYKFSKQGEAFIILWHENPWDVDTDGLVRRSQKTTVDLSGFLENDELRVHYFATEVDENGEPIERDDTFVSAENVVIDETPVIVETASTTAVRDEETGLPGTFVLSQNYPNPFNPVTRIQYSVGRVQFVSLKIYDILGQEVATLVNGEMPAGNDEVQWDGRDDRGQAVAAGIYLIRLVAGWQVQTRRMVVLR